MLVVLILFQKKMMMPDARLRRTWVRSAAQVSAIRRRISTLRICTVTCFRIIIFFWKNKVGVYLWVLCILGNLPFILIQRYNRPRLKRLLRRCGQKQYREELLCAH